MAGASIKDYVYTGKEKLKPEVKAAWLVALRGNRRQVTGELRAVRDDGRTGFCCLGVLCDIGKHSRVKWGDSSGLSYIYDSFGYYDGEAGTPPYYVSEAAGLSDEAMGLLIEMNDAGIGFKRIANWIEKYL